MLLLLALLALAAPSLAQIKLAGSCPSPTVLATFTAADLTTPTWYEARRYYSWLEKGKYCVNWKFTGSGSPFTATTTMTGLWGTSTMTSRITLKTTAGTTADFNYVFTSPWVPGTYNYQILALTADYMVAWSCLNKWGYHKELLWVLTSAKVPSATVVNDALLAASTAGLTVQTNKLETVQQNC